MRVTVEVVTGPHTGRKIRLREGQVAEVGRTEWADHAFPSDSHMSARHFSLECGRETCRVRDLESSNGTWVDKERVGDAILRDGLEFQAGNSRFLVHIEDAPPKPHSRLRQTEVPGEYDPAAAPSVSPPEDRSPRTPESDPPDVEDVPVTEKPPGTRHLAPRVTLAAVTGPHSGTTIRLPDGQRIELGRTEWADHAFSLDPQMSSRHFSVECIHGICRIRDLESSNGTWVNGSRIGTATLRDGDEVRAGVTKLSVRIEGPEDVSDAESTSPQTVESTDSRDPLPSPRVPAQSESLGGGGPEPLPQVASLQAPGPDLRRRTVLTDGAPDGDDTSRVSLEAVAGPHLGQKIRLREGQTVEVGRTEWTDFAFPRDAQMSAKHFSLAFDQRSCCIRDLNSANGTWVNGSRVGETALQESDRVRAGQTEFVVHLGGAASGARLKSSNESAPWTDSAHRENSTHPPQRTAPEESAPRAVEASDSDSAARMADLPAIQKALPPAERRSSAGTGPSLEDEDPVARRQALLAAAWTGHAWLLDYCQAACARPTPENFDLILLLAILGKPHHLQSILAMARKKELGPRRFQILGAYGHPACIDVLLEALDGDDPAAAVVAGAAFTKITGADIDSERTSRLPPIDGGESDEFEEEFFEEVTLPDPKRARAHWNEVKQQLSQFARCCHGLDLSSEIDEERIAQLDMESRWETLLRAKFQGTWQGSPIDLEVFPQKNC